MSALVLSLIVVACVICGALSGMLLRGALPEHHLSPDAKDVVRLGTGFIGTITSLALGLMVSSASGSFNAQDVQVKQMTAKIVLLDQILEQYGPETKPIRELLRRAVAAIADGIWGERGAGSAFVATQSAATAIAALYRLAPANDVQRALKAQAIQTDIDIAQTRLLLFAQQRSSSIPMPFLVVLAFWLTIIFTSFSLFSKPNVVASVSLVIFAISAGCAIFLILQLSQPFTGIMKISDQPLRNALAPVSQ